MFEWIIATKQEKGMLWYTIAGIIALSLVIWGFVEWIYALSIVTILLVWVYTLVENNAPDSSRIFINEDGIMAGDEFFDYAKIETFGIVYSSGIPAILRVQLKTRGAKMIDIDLPQDIPASELRAYLSQFVEENEKSELTLVETLIRIAKI